MKAIIHLLAILNSFELINNPISENIEINIIKDMINTILYRFTKTVTLEIPILAFFNGKSLKYAKNKDDLYLITATIAIDSYNF